ncbi:MAG: DUF72 domain-containing protein, partial [Burkholderiaceae bacterium]
SVADGLDPGVLDRLADCARLWRDGGEPAGLPKVEPDRPPQPAPRDVFFLFIRGAKEKAPAAAMALRQRVG